MSMDINKLLGLAADRSTTARAQLMNTITDFFLPEADRLTEQERAIMSDVLGKLVQSVETDLRRNLAETLARTNAAMPELIALLANDDIEVARPVLERSSLVKDADLIEIVKYRTDEHRLVIALRDQVSEAVSDALVDFGGPDVLEALIRNQDATLSRRAMEYLVAESKRLDRFQEPLLDRNDLPADLAHRMFWWVSAALRLRILREFPVDEAMLDGALLEATRRSMADHDDSQSAQARAMRLAKRMRESGELTDSFLLRALRQQRIAMFVAGLAERGSLSFRTAWRIVSDKGSESFLVLARAIGMGRDTMTSCVLLLAEINAPDLSRRPEVLTAILRMYDELDSQRAGRVLRLWQRDATYQSALDELRHVAAG
jgi:uncharacterized protein (DUF2336 family)